MEITPQNIDQFDTVTEQIYLNEGEINKTIAEYQNFGWTLYKKERKSKVVGNGEIVQYYTELTFAMDKNAPWKDTPLHELQKEYFQNKKKLMKLHYENKPNVEWTFLQKFMAYPLFCMFIVPGVIYIILLRNIKKKKLEKFEEEFEKNTRNIQNRQAEILIDAKDIIQEKNNFQAK